MRGLEAAAATDKGRVRSRNEDAYWVGECAFGVADGMGGHLAGDVASATALLPVQALDGKVFPDAPSAQAALLDAILAANAAVVRKAANEPSLYGMGTTLTATLVEGRRLHVAHVGDSRAYLLRDDGFTQLTRDHTLVAHLIEEGQITKEEAAVHPQRSIITRAIGVDVDLDVDTLTIELQDGDQVLLCSDGLTNPLTDEEIRSVLTSGSDAQGAAQRLVELANENGGPDNITVVLIRYHEDGARNGRVRTMLIRTDVSQPADQHDWAETLGRMGKLTPRGGQSTEHDESREGLFLRRLMIALSVAVVVLGLGALGSWWLLSRSYFVGLDGDVVTIYQGVPAAVGPIELSWVAERTELESSELPPWFVTRLREGIAAADLSDARKIAQSAPRREPAPGPPPPAGMPPADGIPGPPSP
ncbi:MAG: Stp1/IreP family PP2C-type Ser/Thr phosphatase [Actinomycetota bacterium]|nr:Stp1/IreP family PP2C-type Ser/Thr phosphatase [Actinomycetota bacterium]